MKKLFIGLLLLLAMSALFALLRFNSNRSHPASRDSREGKTSHLMIHSDVEFETPYRLRTCDGDFVEVETPGYACPTLADIDNDGDLDLIVGQFAGGNMQLYRNISQPGSSPSFGQAEWITSGEQRAEVPGVS